MSDFLPYSGGGTGGWIGAFGASALAHVGIVAGLVALQSQILELAELQTQEAAFDVAVALEQLDAGILAGVTEQEEVEETAPETLEEVDPVEEPAPEEPEEATPEEPEEAAPEDVEETEPETAEEAEAEATEETEEAEAVEELEAETPEETEAEIVEEASPEDALEELEAETVEATEVESVEAAPEAETLAAGPAESLEAGPVETAALAEPEPSEAVVATPLSADPIGAEEPGGLSPIAPVDGGVATVASVAPVTGGIDAGISVEPVAPVTPTGGGISVAPVDEGTGPDTIEAITSVAPEPDVETIETVTSVAPEPETETVETVTSVAPEPEVGIAEAATAEAAEAAVASAAAASAARPGFDQRAPTAQELRLSELIRRVRQTESDPCLAALPQRAGSDGVGLAMMADNRDAMDAFSTAFVTPEDQDIVQTRAVLDPAQCAAVSFIRNNVDYPATRLGLRLDSDLVDSGGTLTGVLRGSPGGSHMIMLIDDNGVVQDLGRFTSRSGDFFRFEVPVTRDGEPRDTRLILLAASFSQEPAELRARMGQLAQDVFSGLPAELSEGAEIAVATFDVR